MQDMLRYRVTAIDQTGRGLRSVKKELGGVKGALRGVGDSARSAAVMLGRLAGPGAIVAAVGAGLAMFAKSALSAAEAISDTAKATNSSIEGLQKLRFAADQNGLSAQQMDDALLRLTRRMSMFAQDGGGPAAKAIEQLGLNIRDADGNMRSSDDAFREIARRIADIDDAGHRAAIASQLFGDRVGPQLVPLLAQGEDGLRKFGDQAARMGIVLDDASVEKAGAANAKLRALGDSLRNTLHQAVLDNVEAIDDLGNAFSRIIPKIGGALSEATKFASKMAELHGILSVLYNLVGPGSLSDMMPGADDITPRSVAGVRPRRRPGVQGPSLPPRAPLSVSDGFSSGGVQFGPRLGFGLPSVGPSGFGQFLMPTGFGTGTLAGSGGSGGGVGGGLSSPLRPLLDDMDELTDSARTSSNAFKDFARSAITDFRNIGDAARNLASRLIDSLLDRALQPMSDAFGQLFDGLTAGLFGRGSSRAPTSSVRPMARPVPSFDGGGYTGAGARSGGLDGRGGFMAMLHPHEQVIDLARGGFFDGTSGGSAMQVEVNIYGVTDPDAVAREVEARVLPQMRGIAGATVQRARRERR